MNLGLTPEQLAERRNYLGATDASCIAGFIRGGGTETRPAEKSRRRSRDRRGVMKAKLVFEDWRMVGQTESIYGTPLGLESKPMRKLPKHWRSSHESRTNTGTIGRTP